MSLRASSLRNLEFDSLAFDDICFVQGLLRWFKCDFFKWCGKPDCDTLRCGGKGPSMEAIGSDSPSGTACPRILLLCCVYDAATVSAFSATLPLAVLQCGPCVCSCSYYYYSFCVCYVTTPLTASQYYKRFGRKLIHSLSVQISQ